ncbi:hypothetical protein BU14_0086s0010 [Porphyra umbilicalis]|uniref:Uncharacterized protein n=1 Tax=Porphyra umbilicalis TaxID=2786 RepID=A0A1X6PEP5_PORUM|nr:hypothetical protein BU14_0086s0010 [Porphyra umbilicalis]|eukprot:OSX79123.1 hypothetical protein BU14_0086s0010 [Porphyra umbilicalis]
MAFVLPTGAVGASSLHGARVATPAVCANAGIAMRAGGDAPTRRAVLAGALAAAGLAILPDTAQAMGGEGAKQSFFGAKSISNPFTYNEKSKGPIVYKPYNDDEKAYLEKIVTDSKSSLKSTDGPILDKSWEEVRSRLRLEMSLLRKTQVELNKKITDPKSKAAAEKAYEQFKKDIDNLDYAARTKNQDKALKSRGFAITSLDAWVKAVGL